MRASWRGPRTALIGHTGFIGSNIARSRDFGDAYNTSNIEDVVGREYDLVVSAAGRADGHRINAAPEGDRAELQRFAELLSQAEIGRLVHVSTVCVSPDVERCDEGVEPDADELTPYGRNRLELERTLSDRFDTLSVRLPQLFGAGIRKGLVHDLANDHRVEFVHPDAVFQHYDLSRLWSDVELALDADLHVLNLATEPVSHGRVAREVFGRELEPRDEPPASPGYTRDMTTRHAELLGGAGDHVMTADDELAAMARFVADEFGIGGPSEEVAS